MTEDKSFLSAGDCTISDLMKAMEVSLFSWFKDCSNLSIKSAFSPLSDYGKDLVGFMKCLSNNIFFSGTWYIGQEIENFW